MNRKFKLSTALDIDDVLMECVPYAIRLANEKYKFDPPLTIYEVDRWGKTGTRADVIFEFMNQPDFYENQPVIAGAKEFVRKLSGMTEIFVTTSVWPQYMTLRAKRIMEEFPEIPADHIYMGSRKDKIDVDILFDDGMHNIFRSNAAYPILMRRPWNHEATGILAVNNYNEFLKLVEVIAAGYAARPEVSDLSKPGVVVLVGPSGSGKTEVAHQLLAQNDRFESLVSYTTDSSPDTQNDPWYCQVSTEEFLAMNERDELFETTTYAGHYFGSRKQDVKDILGRGKHVLTVMDICGAMAMKTHFDHVITIYIKRDRKDLMEAILNKPISNTEKVNRLMAIESERRNAEVCDYVMDLQDPEQAASQIIAQLNI